MSARDTQFACFAQLLVDDLRNKAHMTVCPNSAYPAVEPLIEKIIARRAYDLACHVATHTITSARGDMSNIPDLTQWPEN